MSGPARIEILTLGDELLDGRVADTNAVYFGRALADLGRRLAQRTSVTDDIEAIVREARAAMARGTELCVVSGGLGPTSDDLTAAAFAKLAGVALVRDESQVVAIEELLTRRGRPVTDNQRKQADRPQGSELVANPIGTAPGFALTHGACRFVVLPGVPRELELMLESAVLEPLRSNAPERERRVFATYGLIEAEVDRRLSALAARHPQVRVGFQVRFPETLVVLSAPAAEHEALEAASALLRQALGVHVFSERDASFAEVILDLLRQRQATLAVAESCTGGLVTDLLTDVPGSSDVLVSGIVAYANAAKESLLGVSRELLRAHGAVSEPVVLAMAHGARAKCGATYAVATSGIAGPGGGTADKPVGTVWVSAVGPQLEVARRLDLPFERRRNKVLSAYAALDLIRRSLGPS